jgi:subtilisin family serine protease
MSWGKKNSLYEEWVIEAIKYAANNDVLLVHGAGNNGMNSDMVKFYPNDYITDSEIVDNFIVVGASGYDLGSKFIPSFSNYGKETVDVFAPGLNIYTTKEHDSYQFARGTSLAAPMVSGLAGLLWSYYPNLKASEIKRILIESGMSLEIPVSINDEDVEKEVLFGELSKSGKIINAYNAFKMASERTKATTNKN